MFILNTLMSSRVAGLRALDCLFAGSQRGLAALHGAGLPALGGLLGQVHRLHVNTPHIRPL